MKKLFVCALALAAFVACDKEPNVSGGEAGNVYMKFSVKMETTRTGTDVDDPNNPNDSNSDATPDVEVGKDRENKISKVDIVLTKADGAYVVAENVTIAPASTDTYVASFNSKSLIAGTAYDVYIYANCSAPATKNLDATSTESVDNMTKDNQFWMTNAYAATSVDIPTDMSAHTTPANPLNLGAHYVERSMARFDFMPKNNNVFTLADGVTVTLTKAAIINQSKEFYMLRRVSTDGTANGAVVGGVETRTNYVVDTDYAAKAGGWVADVKLEDNFDYHMTAPAGWVWKSIAAADLTEADSWVGTNDGTDDPKGDETTPEHDLNEYYIWQYAKENTIPNVEAQDHGISTGVVFKGKIAGDVIANANNERIYVFENKLYGTWEQVVAGAANSATLQAAVNKITAIEAPNAEDYAAAGFTGYSADKDGNYYAYYYYWNRHNDNADNTTMGIMEFAVVRNNVYKLCVDKINKFGHPDPTVPENPDPDPVDPTDPDEEIDYYFTVTVKVLPWVVRVNHIEF